jgi:type III secretory pathway component EscS
MKNKLLKILSIILCAIVTIALFFTVTRVADVTLSLKDVKTIDAAAVECALTENWVGENIINLSKEEIEQSLNLAFPQVKVLGVIKNFPNHITVHVTERKMLFAVKTVLGYDFIDEEGIFLARNSENAYQEIKNAVYVTLPQSENVLGREYQAASPYSHVFTVLTSACKYGYNGKELSTLFTEIAVTDSAIVLQSKTGVQLVVEDYTVETEKKVQYLFSAFVACDDFDKMQGSLVVFVGEEGKIIVDTRRDAVKIS